MRKIFSFRNNIISVFIHTIFNHIYIFVIIISMFFPSFSILFYIIIHQYFALFFPVISRHQFSHFLVCNTYILLHCMFHIMSSFVVLSSVRESLALFLTTKGSILAWILPFCMLLCFLSGTLSMYSSKKTQILRNPSLF